MTDFAGVFKIGNFYSDKTSYIELLEKRQSNAFTLFRPRRFGKTLFLTTLDYYYNVLYKDIFKDLFGHLYIGKSFNGTNHNTFLVLKVDFSFLDRSGIQKFEENLNKIINTSVQKFIDEYKIFLTKAEIIIDKNDAVASFDSLCNS